MGKPLIDLTGGRFGRLAVLRRVFPNNNGAAQWECLCDCGARTETDGRDLRSGKTVSCGCSKRVANLRHGMSHTKTYRIWRAVRERCANKNCIGYKNYGGRGITICDRWLIFEHFLADMGPRPSDGHSIERKDVNGNYEPGNCIWIPRSEQCANTRRNLRFTINGETKILRDWCNQFGLRYGLVRDRIKVLGWSIERALVEPPR